MKACDIERLKDAPAFAMNLACGDSLYHGVERQQMLGDWTDESHYFRTEDADNLRRILQAGTFHAVVANPPYITPKDKAANDAYRRLYSACHRLYSLAVPFMQRIYGLAIQGEESVLAGYTGQITANSFMKREFGRKVIEEYFPTVDLTHMIDTSGAYIPGHSTPTVILFGRNRKPLTSSIRTVMGIRGEPTPPDVASQGLVWSAITANLDVASTTDDFVSVGDSPRERFLHHPWSIGGGGASELKERLDGGCDRRLKDVCSAIGFTCITKQDEVFAADDRVFRVGSVSHSSVRPFVFGDAIRDWHKEREPQSVFFPYDRMCQTRTPQDLADEITFFWPFRTTLGNRKVFGGATYFGAGKPWYEFGQINADRVNAHDLIAFCLIGTHPHFIFETSGKVFNASSPIITFESAVSLKERFGLLGVLNSAVACFWLKQVMNCKGLGGQGGGIKPEQWHRAFEFDSTKLKEVPLPTTLPGLMARQLHDLARSLENSSPPTLVRLRSAKLDEAMINGSNDSSLSLSRMVGLQEELDWQCYRLYDLIDEELVFSSQSVVSTEEADDGELTTESSFPIKLGERAFEVVLARKMARGEVQTTWFELHGSTPITELPEHWPDDYRQLVQRRIEVIESNSQIALIEQPEYKRRWNTEPWDSQIERALRSWLLDRLENYFDFDGRMNEDGKATANASLTEPRLISTSQLSDIARLDRGFMEVAEVYRDRKDFDVTRLVAELVSDECIPLLPVLRYKPSGIDKRTAWEHTWDLQRKEDAIDACVGEEGDSGLTEDRASQLKLDQVGEIPVPPKYKSSDFQSSNYWRSRGKLDVPKERWVSFPHCEGEDQSLVIAWAGYDHLQLTKATSAHLAEVQEKGGSDDPRLVPLLGCILELNPWVKQWHNDVDPDFGYRLGDYFANFVEDEARTLGKTIADIRAWTPPAKTKKRKKKS